MSWAARSKAIEVGSRVAYSAAWLRSTGRFTGALPSARGVVTALIPLGETVLAEIDWGDECIPKRVNMAHLTKATAKGIADD